MISETGKYRHRHQHFNNHLIVTFTCSLHGKCKIGNTVLRNLYFLPNVFTLPTTLIKCTQREMNPGKKLNSLSSLSSQNWTNSMCNRNYPQCDQSSVMWLEQLSVSLILPHLASCGDSIASPSCSHTIQLKTVFQPRSGHNGLLLFSPP